MEWEKKTMPGTETKQHTAHKQSTHELKAEWRMGAGGSEEGGRGRATESEGAHIHTCTHGQNWPCSLSQSHGVHLHSMQMYLRTMNQTKAPPLSSTEGKGGSIEQQGYTV